MKKIIVFLVGIVVFTPFITHADFNANLGYGSSGQEVTELQQYLVSKGFLNTQPTGYFGSLTKSALAAWQTSVGVSPATGYFGVITRAYIASITTDTGSGSSTVQTSVVPGCVVGASFSETTGVPCTIVSTPVAGQSPQTGTTPASVSDVTAAIMKFQGEYQNIITQATASINQTQELSTGEAETSSPFQSLISQLTTDTNTLVSTLQPIVATSTENVNLLQSELNSVQASGDTSQFTDAWVYQESQTIAQLLQAMDTAETLYVTDTQSITQSLRNTPPPSVQQPQVNPYVQCASEEAEIEQQVRSGISQGGGSASESQIQGMTLGQLNQQDPTCYYLITGY